MKGLWEALERMAGDRRVGPVHLAVYVALWWCGEEAEAGAFRIDRRLVMQRAKIQGRTTYYKVMKELDAWGYIEYRPRRGMSRGIYLLQGESEEDIGNGSGVYIKFGR